MDLRGSHQATMDARAAARGHKGPYVPALVYACREEELSFEYRHGPISYGAFTYSLVKTLREARRTKLPQLTFNGLIRKVSKELAVLGYEQRPTLAASPQFGKLSIPFKID
jgi:hypothetical protein